MFAEGGEDDAMFDDGNDDMLVEAAEEVDRTLSNSVISINDSDDDMFGGNDDIFVDVDEGSFLKRRPNNDSLEQVPSTEQGAKLLIGAGTFHRTLN